MLEASDYPISSKTLKHLREAGASMHFHSPTLISFVPILSGLQDDKVTPVESFPIPY